jgi:uncharacterized protein (DUF983 family)
MKAIHAPDGLVKICPRCQEVALGTYREVLKVFGRNASCGDGLTVYCRKCRLRGKGKRRYEQT